MSGASSYGSAPGSRSLLGQTPDLTSCLLFPVLAANLPGPGWHRWAALTFPGSLEDSQLVFYSHCGPASLRAVALSVCSDAAVEPLSRNRVPYGVAALVLFMDAECCLNPPQRGRTWEFFLLCSTDGGG